MLRVLLADDHPVVLNGLRALIDAQPDMTVVGVAPDGETAVREVAQSRPDVVVIDISMPGIGGVEATRRIRRDCPEVSVIALTAHEDPAYRKQLRDAGASSFMLKLAAADDLVQEIRSAVAGEASIAPTAFDQAKIEPEKRTGIAPTSRELENMEAEVLRLVARGRMKTEIAKQLGITVKMVDAYKALATGKLGLTSRADIVRYATERGWLGGE